MAERLFKAKKAKSAAGNAAVETDHVHQFETLFDANKYVYTYKVDINKFAAQRWLIDAQKLKDNSPRGLTTYLIPSVDPRRIEDEE